MVALSTAEGKTGLRKALGVAGWLAASSSRVSLEGRWKQWFLDRKPPPPTGLVKKENVKS